MEKEENQKNINKKKKVSNSGVNTSKRKPTKKKEKKNLVTKETSAKKKVNKVSKNKASKFSTENVLMVIFILLIVVVIILGSLVYRESQNSSGGTKANVVIPVFSEDAHNSVNINASALKKEKEYVIKVTNYRGEDINQSELEYNLAINNRTGLKLKVTKDDDSTNLIKNQESTIIENQSLEKDKKQEIYYHFTILEDAVVEESETISVVITS